MALSKPRLTDNQAEVIDGGNLARSAPDAPVWDMADGSVQK